MVLGGGKIGHFTGSETGGSSGGSYDVDAMAQHVIAGEFGNDDERKRRLGDRYSAVQRRVNEMLS